MVKRALAATGVLLLVVSVPALADPAPSGDDSQRVEHPVVYDDLRAKAADSAPSNESIPHPVVYDTPMSSSPTVRTSPAERPADYYDRPPHPVVTVAPAVAPPTPTAVVEPAPPAATPASTPETDEAVAAEPDNPDYDPTDAAGADTPSGEIAPVELHPEDAQSEAGKALAAMLEEAPPRDLDDANFNAIKAFYDTRKFEPLWVTETGLSKAGRQIVSALARADEWGLDASRFTLPDIADAQTDGAKLVAGTQADLELRLVEAALLYANHARGGRILNPTEQLSSYLDRKPQLKDPMVVLKDLAAAGDPSAALEALHPSHPQFEKLRQKYLAMKAEAAETKIVTLPRGPLLRQGTRHPHVALLRQRLEIPATESQDNAPFDPELFDSNVLASVRAYQEQNSLSVDGLVGNATRRVLNDVDAPSPEKLQANMEQWRWMPDDMGDFYIWVNVPEYKVRVIKNGRVIHSERVITGKVANQTPVFSDELETLYFHPKWHVPQSIKVNELYPSLARGGGYFRKQGLRLNYDGRPVNPNSVDWSTADIRRFHVYQPPGGGNVLGKVKFTFPNKHQVYLHDTPTKHLFKKTLRTFSHGCVRVRDPLRLAEVILEHSNGMTADDVEAIVNGPLRETPVKLAKKVPVHITYFTSFIDDDGTEHSFKDVYGHERKIELALRGRFDQIAVGRDHLAPVKLKPRQAYTGTTAVEVFFNNLFGGF